MFCSLLVILSLINSDIHKIFNVQDLYVDEVCELALKNSLFTDGTMERIIDEYGLDTFRISSVKDFPRIRNCSNSVIIVSQKIDLCGEAVTIPHNSILYFKRGSFSNGTVIGNNTRIVSSNRKIFEPGVSTYRGYKKNGVYGYSVKYDNSVVLTGTWSNKKVGDRWTGIKTNKRKKCQSLAINNLITLHSAEATVKLKKGKYYIYDKVRSTGHNIDFSFSELLSIDFSHVVNGQIRLPEGAISDSLRSVYGLLDINDKIARISNVTINGRSSTRSEAPILGCECLISITNCRGGSFNNITLIDAVDCAICTSDIENVTFNNLSINGCGEHGVYTHAYKGALTFNNCRFDNCGNSRFLYENNGSASCIKAAGLRNHTPNEVLGFKVYFNTCTFYADHKVPVVTTYGDVPYAEYKYCEWEGVNGYVTMNEKFAKETGQPYEYLFFNCDNPCGSYNSSNVVRKLYRCNNVRNPFDDTDIVEDCVVLCCYNESPNRYSKRLSKLLHNPLIVRNCTFIKGEEDVSIRSIVYNGRPMIFYNCRWSFQQTKTNTHRGLYCIEFRKENGAVSGTDYIKFFDCSFSIDQYRLLLCEDSEIILDGIDVQCSYGSFMKEFNSSNNVSLSNLHD